MILGRIPFLTVRLAQWKLEKNTTKIIKIIMPVKHKMLARAAPAGDPSCDSWDE
jgi:hypothetical protein